MQLIRISSFLLFTCVLTVSAIAQMTVVNGASYQPHQPIAPGSFGSRRTNSSAFPLKLQGILPPASRNSSATVRIIISLVTLIARAR